MRAIFTVFAFTFRDEARKKSFIISTIIMLVLAAALCALPAIIGGQSGGDDSGASEEGKPLYYSDEAGLIPGGADALAGAFGSLSVEQKTGLAFDGCRTAVKNGECEAAVIVSGSASSPAVFVITTDFMSGIDASAVGTALQKAYRASVIAAAGLDSELSARLTYEFSPITDYVGGLQFTGYLVGLLLMMIMFFAIYFYGYAVSMSIATEKTSRVMETLVVSTKPRNLLIGKCAASGALGLCQLALLMLWTAGCYKLLVPAGFTIMGMAISFSAFTPVSAVLVLVYFMLGYSLYVMLNSVCGASVSRVEDVNSAMMPVMLITFVSFYASYFGTIMANALGGGSLKTVLSYIPFTSPFTMAYRLLNETVPAYEVAISIVLLLAAIYLAAKVSIGIYSRSVLHYSGRLRLKDMAKLRKRG